MNLRLLGKNSARKRWLDFRNGHSIYLTFLLSMTNFVLITYTFAIKNIPSLNGFFNNIIIFTLFLAAIYIPTSMAIGYWHRTRQYVVEAETMANENWIWAWMNRYLILHIEGKTSVAEDAMMINYLDNILKRHKMDHLIR